VLVIANKLKPLPYLEALLQKDEDTEAEELDGDDKRLKESSSDQRKSDVVQTSLSPAAMAQGRTVELSTSYDSDSLIDNPYLRPIVMPKLKVAPRKSR